MVERIREILNKYQLTPTQFADAIGTARPIVSHILSGRNKPSLEVVQKIGTAYPDISLPWLMFGTGTMEAPANPVRTERAVSPTPIKTIERPVTARVASVERPVAQSAEPADLRPAEAPVATQQPAPISSQVVVPEAVLPTLAPTPVAAPSAAPAPAVAPLAAPIPFQAFSEPGKSIRRIVIFYSDGTFTDYQPEASTA
ncbi:helix-turn-helix domain-containing protein [Hymenobacter fodinae]|uniref:XRE family transcriptional regulator n=1 Tax=Hymenobacter fodinae TaxID=2510796 RepID=A0A4Z0P3S3_9BACT|nr:XRE family transcriptional regulator [Hymenobacter fodinae]